MSVSARLRYEILRRDGHACRYCGAGVLDGKLTVDHVIPVALGGSDTPDNLVAACAACNAGKSSSSPDAPIVEGVADDALRWAHAMREAAQVQAAEVANRNRYTLEFLAAWNDWHYTDVEGKQNIPMPATWEDSIARFHDLGLEVHRLKAFIETAMHRGKRGKHAEFAYLCGMCWRVLDERQEIARGLIETQDDD